MALFPLYVQWDSLSLSLPPPHQVPLSLSLFPVPSLPCFGGRVLVISPYLLHSFPELKTTCFGNGVLRGQRWETIFGTSTRKSGAGIML